jgi:hypothetical protein
MRQGVFAERSRVSFLGIVQRVCQALSPIANIMTGVLLANDRFEEASLTLMAAIGLSLLIGYLEGCFRQG